MKVLLAVGAVLVALLTAGVSGQMLTATGEAPAARVSQVNVADDDLPPVGNPARKFVLAKKEWTACVAEAAPAHEGPGRFDPEAACGTKPHPHDFSDKAGKSDRADRTDRRQGRPAWAGGPDRRTAEPPGHAKHD